LVCPSRQPRVGFHGNHIIAKLKVRGSVLTNVKTHVHNYFFAEAMVSMPAPLWVAVARKICLCRYYTS